MNDEIRRYLAEIGRRGGRRSKRSLTSGEAKQMVRVREARRAFHEFRARCFWSYDPNYRITATDVAWVASQLMKYGDRTAWEIAERLCR